MADLAATIQIITITLTEASTVTAMVTVVEPSTVTMTVSSILSVLDLPLLFQLSSFTVSLVGIVVAVAAALAGWAILDWRRKSEKMLKESAERIMAGAAKKAVDMVESEVVEKVQKIITDKFKGLAEEKTMMPGAQKTKKPEEE